MENETDKIIQELINNPDRDCNYPDEVYFGKGYSYKNQSAFPFLSILLPNENEPRFIIGKPGTTHRDINDKFIEEYRTETNDDFYTLNKKFGGYVLKTYTEYIKMGIDESEAFKKAKYWGVRDWIEENEQAGRYFLIELYDKKICIFTFWNTFDQEGDPGEEPNCVENTELIKMVMDHDPRIKECDYILIANNEEPYYVYKEGIPDDFFKIGDNSTQHAIHLANSQEKRDFFKDFRNNREKQLGDLLAYHDKEGNKTGREMPLAQWNAMRRVEESKEPKRVFLSEEQMKMLSETKKKQYSWKDKLELVKDKNIKDGGNFPIKRNGKIYWISRSITVGVYVFCQDENGIVYTLASKRGPHVHTQQNLWNAPCGYLDYGDSIKETAVKECWEETGVEIPMEKLVYLGENSEMSRNSDVKYTFYCVLDGVISEYPTSMNNCEPGEVVAVRWIPLEELQKYQFVGHQAAHLYNVGTKLFKNRYIYKTDEDYADIIIKLKNMLSKGIIDDKQFERIKNTMNI